MCACVCIILTCVQKYHIIINFFPQGFRSSSANLSVGPIDLVRHVEAKYPALLFKEQLIAYVEKMYGIIRDNVKKDLSPLLSSCIQV